MTKDEFERYKIKFSIATTYVGSAVKEVVSLSDLIDYETWCEMTENERDNFWDNLLIERILL